MKIVIDFFLYLMAIYGLICLITSFFTWVHFKRKFNSSGARLLIMVKNQEQNVEGLIRTIIMEKNLNKQLFYDKLIVLDMGSTDKTFEILSKLEKDYDLLEIINEKEKEKIFTIFSHESV